MAVILLAVLIFASGLSFRQFQKIIAELGFAHISAFLGLSFGMLLMSSIKWQLVMRKLSTPDAEPPTLIASFLYTCLGGALGLVLMPHVAKPMGRAIGARLHGGQSVGKSVTASAFEQVFDLVVILGFASIGLALLAHGLTPVIVIGLVACVIVSLYLSKRPHLLPKRFHISDVIALVRGPIGLRLAAISLIMYALTALRTGIIALPVGISLLPMDFLSSFSIVQLSRLVAVTPMELGVVDWTWAGVLSLYDVPLSIAAGFVLVNRGLNAVSTLIALLVSLILATRERRSSL
ncbi:MAG: lysylphosphatidylglycerol synthase domain-containing protein [Pseudomonadota bacterium]